MQFQEPNYTLEIRAKEFYRLREGQFPIPANDQFIKEIPYVEARSKPLKGKFFTLTPYIGYGNFREAKFFTSLGRVREFETGRLLLGNQIQRVFPIGTHSQLTATLDASQNLYNPGDANYTLQETLALQSRPLAGFQNQATYRRGFFEGNSPFYFDSFSQLYEDVRDRMDFIFWSAARFSLDGGWNVRTLRWYDILANLQLTPAKQFTANLQTAYNFDEGRFRDLTIGSKIEPTDNFSITLSIVHDLVGGTMKSGNSLIVWDVLPKHWRAHTYFRIGHVFDPQTREFKMRDFSIVKDLHCWELRYTYSDFKKESNYLLVLKAFPTQPIGVSGEKGLYFEGVEKAIEQQKGGQRF